MGLSVDFLSLIKSVSATSINEKLKLPFNECCVRNIYSLPLGGMCLLTAYIFFKFSALKGNLRILSNF